MNSQNTPHSLSREPLHTIPDDELLRRLGELVSRSRRVEADLVSHLGEVDERKLYAREACPSMFVYCTERLHLSEAEAFLRITVARAARVHPLLLAMLGDGRLHLSGIARLVPLLKLDNRDALLLRATHLSKRRIVELVAELSPRPDVPAVMRKLPQGRAGQSSQASELPRRPSQVRPGSELGPDGVAGPPSRPAIVEPLSPARYRVQFTASAELHDKLRRLSLLMRSQVPDGDLAAVIEQAVSEKLERLEARRYAQTKAPRRELADAVTAPTSRHIPAAVRRAVLERDGHRCRYVDEHGRRCTERDRLEFHHRHPFGYGGDHSLANISLLCPSHNRYQAERDYGQAAIRSRKSRETQLRL
jgi:5-methylcytosine-specific restriction endonuclease McrA